MIALLAALSVLAASQPDLPGCTLSRVQACTNINPLVWDKSFRAALYRFVGKRRAAYLGMDGTVAVQLLEVLSGPPDLVTRIGSRYRFTACRFHSCDEKGAAVLEPDGRIVALAILHTGCGQKSGEVNCVLHNTLTIYMGKIEDKGVVNNLSSWATSVVAHQNQGLQTKSAKYSLDRVEVIGVP